MSLQTVVEDCLKGLGYELVDLDWRPGGQLCVYIERPASEQTSVDDPNGGIRIEDCERASRQLSHVLLVENIDYARLEVSSPGLDRPLKRRADFERFVGADVSIKLRFAFEGRRNYEGRLVGETDGRFGLDLAEQPAPAAKAKPVAGKRAAVRRTPSIAKAKAPSDAPSRRLSFTLDEIERARLVPRLRF